MLEKSVKEKKVMKKIIISIVFVLLYNFICGNLGGSIVFASDSSIIMEDEEIEEAAEDDADTIAKKVKNELVKLIFEILLLIPDSILWILQKGLIGDRNLTVEASSNEFKEDFEFEWYHIIFPASIGADLLKYTFLDGLFELPTVDYTPDTIFANKVPAFDINFFNPNEYEIDKESTAKILQKTVSNIYRSFRMLATIALLTILVYVGIRMLLTSIAAEKAKYKQMLIDWLVALIMLFALNYIMSFVINTTQILTKTFNNSSVSNILLPIPNDTEISTKDEEIKERVIKKEEIEENLYWKTNFAGYIRYYAGLAAETGVGTKGLGYILIYIVLVIYIVIFTWQYLKRVIYLAFLTMIAPLVAITYPLDKVNDGKAQGFNMWIKEYIFNALLQPIHYIIYVVVVGSSMGLIEENLIFGIVALGFMIPAEKFIRKMFGFEKASTVGKFGAAAGAAALMGAVQKLSHKPHLNKGGGNTENEKISDTSSLNRGIKKINSIPNVTDDNNSNVTLDAYDEKFGTSDWDSAEREMLARESENRTESNTDVWKNQKEYLNWTAENEGLTLIDKTRKHALLNGAKSVAGHYSRRMKGGIKKIHPVRALRRGLTYGLGAATLGAIGLAAGIASGDPSKALQYTMAGGMVGGNLGRNIGETTSNIIGAEDAVKSFRIGVLGERYEEKERKKYNRDFKNNVSNYDRAIRKVNTKGWEEMSKDGGIIDSSLDYGINNIDDMCNIYKIQQRLMNNGMDEERAKENAFRAYKLSSHFGDYSSNSKTQENLDKILNSKGYSAANKIRMKKEIIDLIEIYKDISKD